jgi:MoaA/NifB/PqqE/SkfB family radical SAM enzyme
MNFRCERALSYLELYHGGDLWLCCPNWTTEPLGNIFRDDPIALWHGPRAQRIRQAIARGDFSYCRNCSYQPAPFALITPAPDDIVPEVTRIPRLFVAFDRSCNLHCPSCRHEIFRYPWNNDREVRRLYDRLLGCGVLAEVDSLRLLSSGDPFASKLAQETLHRLPWDDYPLLHLHFQTNGLLFTPERYEALGPAKLRLNSVSVSTDAATRETYAKLRSRGNLAAFDVLQENLRFVAGLKEQGALDSFVMVLVIQADNYREIVDFARQALDLGAKAEYMLLNNWGTFTPEEFATKAVQYPDHPEHEAFVRLCEDPIFSDPRIIMVNPRAGEGCRRA